MFFLSIGTAGGLGLSHTYYKSKTKVKKFCEKIVFLV